MEEGFDPNIPDSSDGDFFCRLCLVRANSDHMWACHIAGRRHIRNVMKYPNGVPLRQNDNEEDSYENSAKYGRYENDDWDDCPPREYTENEFYTRRSYVPEIRPRVIDYGHKNSLPEEISPLSKIFDDATKKKKDEDPIDKIFGDENYDHLKKSFEEKIFQKAAGAVEQNKWNSNNLKQNRKETLYDDDFEEEGMKYRKRKLIEEEIFNKQTADGMQQNKWSSKNLKQSREETLYDDDFEKELDELLKSSSNNSDSKGKDPFCKDEFKKKIDDILVGKSSNEESKDNDIEITKIVKGRKDGSHKSDNKMTIIDHSISVKKRDDKDKIDLDRDSNKKKGRRKDEEDFIDIFHKMNDQKLFKMSAAEEVEDSSHVKKSSKTEDLKLDEFDPDKLTPDLLDNLLSSYLKPKIDSSKGKDSAKTCTKNSEKGIKEDDPGIIAGKLESLPNKTFFQIILTRLKNLDLKDSNELKILLEIISQAQEVVCKKLPPHLQAVIKSKMSHNQTKTTALSAQNPVLHQTNCVTTTLPKVPQTVSQTVLPSVSQSAFQTVSHPMLTYSPQPPSREEVKSVSQSVSQKAPQSVQTSVSYPISQTKPPFLNTSDSFQSMIAWQNYLTSMGTASTKQSANPSNSIQATIAYQNYLSGLQAKALTASKTPSENLAPKNALTKSKTTLSSSLNHAQTLSQTVSQSSSGKSSSSTSNSAQSKETLQNFLSKVQAALSKTVSQTPSDSLTKSVSPSTNSSRNQPALKISKYVPQSNAQAVSSIANIPRNPAPTLNDTALQNYQTYYQQMYAMYLQRMNVPSTNASSLPSASHAAVWPNLAVSQPNYTFPPFYQPSSTK